MNQPAELVNGVEHFFHVEFRLHLAHQAVAVAHHRVDEGLVVTRLLQNFHRFLAVLLRVFLVVHVVQEPHTAPVIRVLPGLCGEVLHNSPHFPPVLHQGLALVILPQQGQCLFFHTSPPLSQKISSIIPRLQPSARPWRKFLQALPHLGGRPPVLHAPRRGAGPVPGPGALRAPAGPAAWLPLPEQAALPPWPKEKSAPAGALPFYLVYLFSWSPSSMGYCRM